jgi:hypothetical protein
LVPVEVVEVVVEAEVAVEVEVVVAPGQAV